jgi:hypothetical protein
MKFTIQSLEQQTVQTKFGPKQKFRFTSNGQTYDAWAKKGYTDQFNVGYSFEAELSGKPYKGIDTVQWPKADQYQVQKDGSLSKLDNGQLDRIEAKIDRMMEFLLPKNYKNITVNPSNLPYADSPAPSDEDAPF